jgi:predicted DNA-binding transcriptional regulator AlpA
MSDVRILLYKDLRQKGIPYSRQHIGELERNGRFPQRVALGGGGHGGGALVGWFEHEVDQHLLNLPRGSRMRQPPWLELKDKPAPSAPRRCAYPGCEADTGQRGGPRGSQPKYCERHGHRRKRQAADP